MKNKSPNFAKKIAISSLGIAFVVAVFGLFTLPHLKTEYSVMQFLPAHHPALKMDQQVRKRFKIEDRPTFIGLLILKPSEPGKWLEPKRIARLNKLTAAIQDMQEVQSALSVTNVSGAANIDGNLTIGELVKVLPAKDWKARILGDSLLTPNLITADGRTVLIYVQLKHADVDGLVKVESMMKQMLPAAFPEANTSVGGVPAIQTDLGLLLNKELLHFLLLTLIACALTLFMIFRSPSTIGIPLTLTLFCNIMVFAFIVLSGVTFTILSATIPILVFIDVMTISCHILLRIYEEAKVAKPETTRWQLIVKTNKAIWLPNALGSLTTCTGFLTLLLSDVPLIRAYGLAVAESILISSVLTSIGIVPLLLLFPMPQPRAWVHRPARWSLWVFQHHKMVVASTLALCCFFGYAGRQLNWTGKLFDDLPKGQEARRSTEKIDRSMGGVVPVEIEVHAPKGKDWVDPKRLKELDKVVKELRETKGVGTAQSLPDFLLASGLLGSSIPPKRTAIAETYFLYGMSTNNPLSQYLTSDNRSALIEMKIHDLPSNQAQSLIQQVKRKVQKQFPDSRVQVGGMGAVVHTVHNEISHELIFGFWQALFLIVGLLSIVFRSLRWAAVAAIPNLVPPIILLGYLSLTNTPIKPGVAIIFSIALGLAFTNTVYALNRLRELRKKGQALPIRKTFHMESNPCLISTLVVMMGFSVFLFSYFELNRTFGACMIVSIVAGILGDLVFLPALLRYAPWLLERKPPATPTIVPPDSFAKAA